MLENYRYGKCKNVTGMVNVRKLQVWLMLENYRYGKCKKITGMVNFTKLQVW